jgi:hypothetical protein
MIPIMHNPPPINIKWRQMKIEREKLEERERERDRSRLWERETEQRRERGLRNDCWKRHLRI